MSEEYNVRGLIIQPHEPNVIFSGNFRHENDNSIGGELQDIWGKSRLEGQLLLEKGILKFNKTYTRRVPIIYTFQKEGNLWIGKYNGIDSGPGESLCEFVPKGNPFETNWEEMVNNVKMDFQTAEEYARFGIQQRVNAGMLEEFPDPETGEIMIRSRSLEEN